MHVCMYVCVCTYVCVYVCMYVCMYACLHACMHLLGLTREPTSMRQTSEWNESRASQFWRCAVCIMLCSTTLILVKRRSTSISRSSSKVIVQSNAEKKGIHILMHNRIWLLWKSLGIMHLQRGVKGERLGVRNRLKVRQGWVKLGKSGG